MSEIVVSSTTDTPEQVNAAIEHYGLKPGAVEAEPAAAGEETQQEKQPAPGAEETPAEGESAAAPGAEEDHQEPEETETDKPVKGKGGFQKRIDKLTREKREAEAEVERLKQELADKSAAKPAETKPEPTKPEETAKADEKPELENFETYEEYVAALAAWSTRQEVKALRDELKAKEEQQAAEAKAAAERQPLIDAWNERAEAAQERYPDYAEVTQGPEAEKLELSQVMHQAIFESPAGPDIAYYLGKNPEECRRIAGLSPIAAVREIGRLEAKLAPATGTEAKTPETPKPKPSAAPAPIRPVGTRSASSTKDPGSMTPAEYADWRQKNYPRR